MSMATRTDIYGCDGNDSRYRGYVKKILEKRFGKDIIFIPLSKGKQKGSEIVSKAVLTCFTYNP